MNEKVLKGLCRLAVEGEQLVVYRFSNGSTGLVCSRNYDKCAHRRNQDWLHWLLVRFSFHGEPGPRVYVPAGSWLQLIGIPEVLRDRARGCPDAIFVQISTQSGIRCDALALAYGNALLQFIPEGQQLKILSLSSRGEIEPELDELEPAPLAGAGL